MAKPLTPNYPLFAHMLCFALTATMGCGKAAFICGAGVIFGSRATKRHRRCCGSHARISRRTRATCVAITACPGFTDAIVRGLERLDEVRGRSSFGMAMKTESDARRT